MQARLACAAWAASCRDGVAARRVRHAEADVQMAMMPAERACSRLGGGGSIAPTPGPEHMQAEAARERQAY